MQSHLKARQADDLRHDRASRILPSERPFSSGQHVFYWDKDSSKNKSQGRWFRGKVLSQAGPMVTIKTATGSTTVNQSRVRKDHDEWHHVPPPRGLQEPLLVEPPELADVDQPTDAAQFVFFMAPDQAFVMEVGGKDHAMTRCMSLVGYDVAYPMSWSHMSTETRGPK